MSSETAGVSMMSALGSCTERTCLPLPSNTPDGSSSEAPERKNSRTTRGYTAMEKRASEVRSVGEKPIASAL
jgi:hypothetical protein